MSWDTGGSQEATVAVHMASETLWEPRALAENSLHLDAIGGLELI